MSDTRRVSCLQHQPPQITCPAQAVAYCTSSSGAPDTVTVGLSSPVSETLQLTWTVDGNVVQPDAVSAGASTDCNHASAKPGSAWLREARVIRRLP